MAKIEHASNGKRDLHNLEKEYDKALIKLRKETWDYPKNKKIVLDYLKACKQGLAKSGNSNKRVSKPTLYRIMGILRLLSDSWIKKTFDKTTQIDWDKFYNNMEENKIKNEYNKVYKSSTKAKNYKTIRKFLKWRYGKNKFYPEFCDNWVTAEETPTKEFLARSQVEKMITAASSLRLKCMIMMLFDGGFRIEELSNLRWRDVQRPEGRDYYRAYVRAETSKTKKERHVSLWLSTDLIDMYRNSVRQKLKQRFNESDYMFMAAYTNMYNSLLGVGQRALGIKTNPHMMRHSSATYYSGIIKTYQQFCSRYGWNLRSTSPQRYFHKVDDDAIADQTKDHEIAKFKTEFEKMRIENIRLREEMDKMPKLIIEALKAGDLNPEKIRAELARRSTRG